jgi:hypothetical protein
VDQLLGHPLLRSVILTTSSGIHAPAMAEYILMMVLAFAHHLPRMIEHQRRAEWPQQRWALFVPRELRDATIGIVGYGSIGRETARLARAFAAGAGASARSIGWPTTAGAQRQRAATDYVAGACARSAAPQPGVRLRYGAALTRNPACWARLNSSDEARGGGYQHGARRRDRRGVD